MYKKHLKCSFFIVFAFVIITTLLPIWADEEHGAGKDGKNMDGVIDAEAHGDIIPN